MEDDILNYLPTVMFLWDTLYIYWELKFFSRVFFVEFFTNVSCMIWHNLKSVT